MGKTKQVYKLLVECVDAGGVCHTYRYNPWAHSEHEARRRAIEYYLAQGQRVLSIKLAGSPDDTRKR